MRVSTNQEVHGNLWWAYSLYHWCTHITNQTAYAPHLYFTVDWLYLCKAVTRTPSVHLPSVPPLCSLAELTDPWLTLVSKNLLTLNPTMLSLSIETSSSNLLGVQTKCHHLQKLFPAFHISMSCSRMQNASDWYDLVFRESTAWAHWQFPDREAGGLLLGWLPV